MCFLNLILISFVTVTQSIAIPPSYLSAAIELHPSFSQTLLNKTVVPYLEECETSIVKGGTSEIEKTKMLCGSYLEMVTILDANKIDALKNKNDFDMAMNSYDKKNASEFCAKFPEHIPRESVPYPESNKLFKFVDDYKRCQELCMDTNVITFTETVKPFCRLIAYGFLHSEKLPQAITTTNAVKSSESTKPAIALAALHLDPNSDTKSFSPKLLNSTMAAHPDINSNELENKVKEQNKNVKIEASQPSESSDKILAKPKNVEQPKPAESDSAVTEVSSPNEQPGEETFSANVDETLPSILDKSKTVTSEDPINVFDNNDFDDAQGNLNPVKDKLSNDEENSENIIEDGDEAKRIDDDDDIDSEIAPNIPDKFAPEQSPSIEQSPSKEQLLDNPFLNDPDSNFFTYFMFILLGCVIAYVVYHNKTKMLALILEGRRSSTSGRGSLSRRKHTAAYRKLDSNLEEAITSSANNRSTQVIY